MAISTIRNNAWKGQIGGGAMEWGTANGWMATKGGRASELALREGGKRADSGVVKWRLRANSNPMNLVLIKGDFVPPFRLYQ